LTAAGRRPVEKEEFAAGKSQTCRASEWQSHCRGRIDVRGGPARSQICCCRFNGLPLDRSLSGWALKTIRRR